MIALAFWVAAEGVFWISIPEIAIAVAIAACGWHLRKKGIAALNAISTQSCRHIIKRWVNFFSIALPVVLAFYIVGYFAFMDRATPTSPAVQNKKYQSSFRWLPHEWMDKTTHPYFTPWREVSIWNFIYEPMDKLWFHFFPRSQQEREKLRDMGFFP